MRNYILDSGFSSYSDFFIKVVLPSFSIAFVLFFMTVFFTKLPFFVPYLYILLAIVVIAIVPYLRWEQRKLSIHENIHLFITYAGTLSTLKINRTMLFKKISEEKEYGELATISTRIIYLAKSWNLGYAKTCRKIATHCPSKIFSDFLDRLAAVLDFGEDLEVFLTEEQDAVMDDFANEYKQSLQSITVLQDVFISLTISVAFGMASALLLPLLVGTSIMVIVQYSLLGLVLMDLMLVAMIKGFIPSDRMAHNLDIIDEGTKKIVFIFTIIAPLVILLTGTLLYFNKLPFLFNIAIGFSPLFIIGLLGIQEENEIYKRDKAFPTFIRAVGGTTSTKGGSVTTTLAALKIHDFGVLQPLMVNLYRRLRSGSDKFKAWYYFAGESGSNLINYFVFIFVKSVNLGGDGIKVSEIISKNFTKLLSLRKLRLQLASGLRGALYGALVGFVTTIYMATAITALLSGMFSDAMANAQSQENVANLVNSILPPIPSVDMNVVNFYIGLIVIFHSFISAIVIKMVDGGNKYAAMFDFVIMLWIGAILGWGIPLVSSWAFGSVG